MSRLDIEDIENELALQLKWLYEDHQDTHISKTVKYGWTGIKEIAGFIPLDLTTVEVDEVEGCCTIC